MSRPPSIVAFALLATSAALAAPAPEVRSTGATSTAVERSTGQVETALAALPIVESLPLAIAPGADRAQVEGKISRRGPVEVVLSPVPAGMLDVGVAAKSGAIWMSVFRDDATEPLAGTAASGRTTRWISSADGAAKLRIVAYHAGDETPFRVSVRVSKPLAGD
jgi:hypothetical protein